MADSIITFMVLLSITLIYGDDPFCNDQLVKNLPDSHLSSSDNRADPGLHTGPERGRLNTTEVKASNGTTLEGAWSPTSDSSSAYIQAMFDDVTMINSVMTQGRNQGNEYVKLYTIQYTEDGNTWETIKNDIGIEKIFQGNSDSDSIQDTQLDCPIFAKGIRIVPFEWEKRVALRFDVKGCNLDNNAAVMSFSSPTFLPGIVTPFGTKSTTVNMLTLIQWFKTALSNVSSSTTPVTTSPVAKTTTPYVFHPGVPPNLIPSVVTTKLTTPMTTVKTTRATLPPFMPGIINPFGTTKKAFVPGLIG